MKKICFIEPPYEAFMEQLDAPFPLLYLAAIAEQQGWTAEILDMQTPDDPIPQADVYAVTATSPQWPQTIQLSQRLAEEFPDQRTVVGGNHISCEPHDYATTQFDLAVLGEGERALQQILAHPTAYHGIIHGEPIHNLDTIPFPARHLIDWTQYKRGIYWGNDLLAPAVSIISSRGCPFNCCYCGSHVIFGRGTRFRSAENVVEELRQVIAELGYRGFNFHDDTFCLNRNRVLRLCAAFTQLDIVWRCLSRVDTVDEDLLIAMANAGCKELILGVESGSQRILNKLQKGTTVKQNLTAMQLTKQAGIQLKVGIIVGSPGETWDTVAETKRLLQACPPDFWNVSVFTPFPGTAVWKNPQRYGIRILTKDLSQYAMVGKDFRGNVVVETEELNKSDIEHARDELIDLLQVIAPQ